jgi:hypothetical protein
MDEVLIQAREIMLSTNFQTINTLSQMKEQQTKGILLYHREKENFTEYLMFIFNNINNITVTVLQ